AFIDTLAWIYYKQKQYPKALNEQLRAVQISEARREPVEAMAELYYHLGAIYEGLARKREAVDYFTRALRARNYVYPEANEGLKRLGEPGGAPGPGAPRRPRFPSPSSDPAVERGIL
ncbi:MAG TPA: tetratricopeptide repeat protein, partial [Armatimonadota bacterium]|nr:tetratricopeptide repeat protein [Armatimonadota bacterium]